MAVTLLLDQGDGTVGTIEGMTSIEAALVLLADAVYGTASGPSLLQVAALAEYAVLLAGDHRPDVTLFDGGRRILH